VSVPILKFGEFFGEILSRDQLNWIKIIPEEENPHFDNEDIHKNS
jgi:hypothetical protein